MKKIILSAAIMFATLVTVAQTAKKADSTKTAKKAQTTKVVTKAKKVKATKKATKKVTKKTVKAAKTVGTKAAVPQK